MFRPKIPTMPQPTGPAFQATHVEPTANTPGVQTLSSAPVAPVSPRTAVRFTPGSALALAGGGTAVVLVVGAVLVSMLLAVAITATSVAVCAVVIRSILTRR
ncbi:SpdD-like protein [Streptomyces sp. NPDC102394]|uniref:SpdD-like protein n=1 Tax=Streptomyces sp. NPDC102394 TaxID=3366167 RepID=UPI003805A9D4